MAIEFWEDSYAYQFERRGEGILILWLVWTKNKWS